MLHILVTSAFVVIGAISLTLIVTMLLDAAPQIGRALGLRAAPPAASLPGRRVRVVRTRRLSPKLSVPLRAAA